VTPARSLQRSVSWLWSVFALGTVYACGSSSTDLDDPLEICEGNAGCGDRGDGGQGSGDGSSGNGSATDGIATDGDAATGGSGSSGTPAPLTNGPHFPGSGSAFRPLTPGCGPETARLCTGACEQGVGITPTEVVRPPATLCFSSPADETPEDPAVVIEQVIERAAGKEYVHVRVTFDPTFTDNTYGAGSSEGWPRARGHRFRDLTSSDHTELLLLDATADTAMSFKIDLITADANAACGYSTLGVSGGDGSMLSGNGEHVLAAATSTDRNLNGCGYCTSPACAPSGDCTVDSPNTDEAFTPAAETRDWDYRQVYEVWIDTAAFGAAGFGQALVTYTHSSPAKSQEETLNVEPSPCPPTWDDPYCPPSVILEGGNCFGSPPDGSDPGAPCPPNQQVYLATEGASVCTPIPFTNNPGGGPCPAGYTLDLASEGQFCVPTR
jgi:hypothetical protein